LNCQWKVPDILLIDLRTPDLDGLRLVQINVSENPIPVVACIKNWSRWAKLRLAICHDVITQKTSWHTIGEICRGGGYDICDEITDGTFTSR